MGSGHNWDVDVAPPMDIVICPTCPATDGLREEDAPTVAEKEQSELINSPTDEIKPLNDNEMQPVKT